MNLEFVMKIIELYKDGFSRELTILDISKLAGMSYNATHRHVEFLAKQKVLNSRKIGPSRIITLNNTPLTLGYLTLAESFQSKDLKELLKKVGDYGKRLV